MNLPREIYQLEKITDGLRHSANLEEARDNIIGNIGTVPIHKSTLKDTIQHLEGLAFKLTKLCEQLDNNTHHRTDDVYDDLEFIRKQHSIFS